MHKLKIYSGLPIMCIFFLTVCLFVHAADWMPDAHLEQTVGDTLGIPNTLPMHPADMAEWTYLVAEHDIKRLNGLEPAFNLEFLHIANLNGDGVVVDL